MLKAITVIPTLGDVTMDGHILLVRFYCVFQSIVATTVRQLAIYHGTATTTMITKENMLTDATDSDQQTCVNVNRTRNGNTVCHCAC